MLTKIYIELPLSTYDLGTLMALFCNSQKRFFETVNLFTNEECFQDILSCYQAQTFSLKLF